MYVVPLLVIFEAILYNLFIKYAVVTHLNWRMASSGMLHRVALVKTDVSEELSASFIKVTRIGELGTTLAIASNRLTLVANYS
jgi:hypothetical protein